MKMKFRLKGQVVVKKTPLPGLATPCFLLRLFSFDLHFKRKFHKHYKSAVRQSSDIFKIVQSDKSSGAEETFSKKSPSTHSATMRFLGFYLILF